MDIEIIVTILVLLALIPAIVCHEVAHGFVAYLLGDKTAKSLGRLSLNPLKHVDPVGTILVPSIIFGLRIMGLQIIPLAWAKPVPVNMRNFKDPWGGMALVAIAGPLTNLFIALFFFILFKLDLAIPEFLQAYFAISVGVNVILMVFNLIPFPPLDGSRIVMWLLPPKLRQIYAGLERYGIILLLILLQFGISSKVLDPVLEFLSRLLEINFL